MVVKITPAWQRAIIHWLGGVTREEWDGAMAGFDELVARRDAEVKSLKVDYYNATQRIKDFILRETFGKQQFEVRQKDFTDFLVEALPALVKTYFEVEQPKLYPERWS